jgi:peroxiredoxin
MTIAIGDHLPEVEFLMMTGDGQQKVSTDVIFVAARLCLPCLVPFTHLQRNHLPGFLSNVEAIKAGC